MLNRHFDQAHELTFKIRFRIAAAIYNDTDCGNDRAVDTDDVDCFLHAPATRHDVLDYDEFFALRNLKTSPQNKLALVFFDKDVAFA